MVVVVTSEIIVMNGHDYTKNEQQKEDEQTKVDVCYHLVPAGHLVLEG